MGLFILRRSGVMIITALCLTFIVFFLTNLYPNLEKLAKTQGNMRMTDSQVESWLEDRGYLDSLGVKYGRWLGVLPGWVNEDPETGKITGRCIDSQTPEQKRRFAERERQVNLARERGEAHMGADGAAAQVQHREQKAAYRSAQRTRSGKKS